MSRQNYTITLQSLLLQGIIFNNFSIGDIMDVTRALGIIALIIGVIVLGFGLNSTQAVTEKVVEGLFGRYTEGTMWFIVSGITLIIFGVCSIKGCCKK